MRLMVASSKVSAINQFMQKLLLSHWLALERILTNLKRNLVQELLSNLVTWHSKKQSFVALSSTEAEYRAMTQAMNEMLWLQS
ncbi:secreted RxLR effector protein 161-like [Aristolochia californica]|uniref:secreted RxLR effector protein 161-like n=1 Tax=Aristolochia californica TaxID=171875 RepID=UPI0035D63E8A